MKFICSKAKECDKPNCPHRHSHDAIPACSFPCGRVAGAECVMDVAALPVIGKTGTVAIMIKRREKA